MQAFRAFLHFSHETADVDIDLNVITNTDECKNDIELKRSCHFPNEDITIASLRKSGKNSTTNMFKPDEFVIVGTELSLSSTKAMFFVENNA